MAELPILYSFRRCPYAMRARLALLIAGVTCEIREVVLRDKPAAMVEISPKATVPVLLLPSGEVIDQSLDIMHWAFGQNTSSSFPRRRETQFGVSQSIISERQESHALENMDPRIREDDGQGMIETNDGPFKRHLDRYKYPDRHDENSMLHRAAAIAILTNYEDRLQRHAFLCGETASIADFAIMPFVRQFAAVDQAWFDAQPLPMLQRWLAQHIASPLFERAMIRLPQWHEGDAPTFFPYP